MLKLVVDSSVLVGEALRARGLTLLSHSELTLYQPQHAVNETQHELRRRLTFLGERLGMTQAETKHRLEATLTLHSLTITIIAHADYAPFEAVARRRVPRDPNDWTLVAAALSLGDAGILTLDNDFLGCGLPTWTPETLRGELGL